MIVNLSLKLVNNWKKEVIGDNILWFKGFAVDNIQKNLIEFISNNNFLNIKNYLKDINGQFSFVYFNKKNNFLLFANDKISSIPIYFSLEDDKISIFNFVKIEMINQKYISQSSLLQMKMSGYCLGNETITKKIKILNAGQVGSLNNDKFYLDYYFIFKPWLKKKYSEKELFNFLDKAIIGSMKDLIEIANNKTIVVPLSDGHDSRLILSTLKYLNYENVICFSYGKNNTKLKKITTQIAKELKYKHFYLITDLREKRKFFVSDVYLDFIKNFNSIASIPSVQDIFEISYLKKNNLIPPDAIIVNGHTGDYISGGHIPSDLLNLNISEQKIKSLSFFINKNYSLWQSLINSKTNYLFIEEKLINLLKSFPLDFKDFKYESSVYEFLEYYSRQCKYIMNQQIVYDYFGYKSYMPLWNDKMIEFWITVEDSQKINQKLYKKFLFSKNYGKVWNNIPVNINNIKFITKMLRFLTKSIFILFKDSWKKFDTRFFKYWIDDTCNYAIINYLRVIFTRDNHKNYISWVGKKYFEIIKFKNEK